MDAELSLLSRIGAELGADPRLFSGVTGPAAVPLPSRLATGDLAWASVAAVCAAAGLPIAELDPARIAFAYRSDRVLAVDGTAPPVWSPFSGFWRTDDGWVRTHGNYPHHAAALRAGLGLGDAVEFQDVAMALSARTSADAVSQITAAGGLAVHVAAEKPERDAALRERPVLEVQHIADHSVPRRFGRTESAAPLHGVRVLDLTRVIAGPVCTRTLALLGADVLRIDPPHLPEPVWQHFDTGHGKRSALLDARAERMHELLAQADVIVLGYRRAALTRLGLDPADLAERHPGLLVAQLSAWGVEAPERAGFDSLVQAESGIAMVESADGDRPGALPAQALDHSAGYLLAAAVVSLLERGRREGGTWHVRTSLRRIAAELLGMPRRKNPEPETALDPAPHIAAFQVGETELITTKPALPGLEYSAPRAFGGDQPRW